MRSNFTPDGQVDNFVRGSYRREKHMYIFLRVNPHVAHKINRVRHARARVMNARILGCADSVNTYTIQSLPPLHEWMREWMREWMNAP